MPMTETETRTLLETIAASLVPRIKKWAIDPAREAEAQLRSEIVVLRRELHTLQVEKSAMELRLRTVESQALAYPHGLAGAKVTP